MSLHRLFFSMRFWIAMVILSALLANPFGFLVSMFMLVMVIWAR